MINRSRRRELAQHLADRRRREDEAPRLLAEVPALSRLSLAVEERAESGFAIGSSHTRRVVVEHAAARFEVPCSAGGCDGGVHDLTSGVMLELHRGSARFESDTRCDRCGCVLHHVATAEYR
jgi:hypothetical protein